MTDRWHQKQNKYQARTDRNLIIIRKCEPHFEYWGFQPREILAKQKSFKKSLVCIFLFPFSCACVYVCFWGGTHMCTGMWKPRVDLFSPLFTGAESLSQTQCWLKCLVLLGSLLWGVPILAFWGWNCRLPPGPPGMYMVSGDLNSDLRLVRQAL